MESWQIINKNAHEKVLAMKPFIHPELLKDEVLDYFQSLGQDDFGNRCEDIEDLQELMEKLQELNSAVSNILFQHMGAYQFISKSLNHRLDEAGLRGWYSLNPETLTANEVLYLISYPFWTRGNKSWQVRFALTGMLGKYLSVYKEKCEEAKKDEIGKQSKSEAANSDNAPNMSQ